jgi:hypothetical protein
MTRATEGKCKSCTKGPLENPLRSKQLAGSCMREAGGQRLHTSGFRLNRPPWRFEATGDALQRESIPLEVQDCIVAVQAAHHLPQPMNSPRHGSTSLRFSHLWKKQVSGRTVLRHETIHYFLTRYAEEFLRNPAPLSLALPDAAVTPTAIAPASWPAEADRPTCASPVSVCAEECAWRPRAVCDGLVRDSCPPD